MGEPVADEEGRVFGKISVVEDENEFASIGTKALNRMRNAAGEKPKVAGLHIANEFVGIFVYAGDAAGAVGDVRPFRRDMPVQFAYSACRQAHVDASHVFRDRKVANGDFTRPSGVGMPIMYRR